MVELVISPDLVVLIHRGMLKKYIRSTKVLIVAKMYD